MKKVAVVILNWNGKKLLEQFLPSVVSYTSSDLAEIVVADNASTDDSVSFMRANYPDIRLLELDQNYGFAEGYNRALREIEAEYFVLLNSDVEVSENWLEPLVYQLDSNKQVAAVQPKIRAFRNKEYFEYAGAAGGFIDKYGYPFCRGRIFTSLEKDQGQYDSVADIFWATGACLVIRSKDYFSAGGLDASFFAHMEEIDLCWRLNARGRVLQCVPQSVVYHVGGATLNQESPKKTFLNFRNNLLMLYKNLPDSKFKPIYRTRKMLDRVAAFKFLLTGNMANAKAVLSAYSEFTKIKSQYDSVRLDNLNNTTQKVIPTQFNKNILSAYYLKGKKVYSALKNF